MIQAVKKEVTKMRNMSSLKARVVGKAAMVVAWLSVVGWALSAQAGPVEVLDDRSFFDNIPHTLIDFETRGDGTPIILDEGQFISLDYDDYVGQGVQISGPMRPFERSAIIGNSLGVAFDSAVSLIGSQTNVVAEPAQRGMIRFDFLQPVRAIGISVIHTDALPVQEFSFLDDSGTLILTVPFEGGLIDGVIPASPDNPGYDFAYGFVGLSVSDAFVGSLILPNTYAALDDLRFAVVPEPSTAFVVFFGLFAVLSARKLRYQPVIKGTCVLLAILCSLNSASAFGDTISGHVTGRVLLNGQPLCGALPPIGCINPIAAEFVATDLEGVRVCIQETSVCTNTLADGTFILTTTSQQPIHIFPVLDGTRITSGLETFVSP